MIKEKDINKENNIKLDNINNDNEEMRLINRQLYKKRKEYEYLKKEHEKLEIENVIILNLLENLISECQEVKEPLERRSKDINQEQLKMKILIYRLKTNFRRKKRSRSSYR